MSDNNTSSIIRYDLGCGNNKREGFFGVDKFKTDSTDAVCDLLQFPWTLQGEFDGMGHVDGDAENPIWSVIPSDSVEEAHCSNFFEHIPAAKRKPFMEELHRVLKKGAKAQFITPLHDRMYQDPTHEWPPIVPGSYLYFNQQWLKDNKLMHGEYVTTADFDYSYGYGLHPNVAARNAEYQQYAIQFYNNAASDLYVTLVKK